jgi:hypothetical protein
MARPRKNCILVLTDSRGKGLQELIDRQPVGYNICDIIVQTIPGAKLSDTIKSAELYLGGKKFGRGYSVKLVCIQAGICDLTTLKLSGNNRYIEYHRKEDVVKELLDKIARVYSLHSGRINISTIAPASIEQSLKTRGLPVELIEDLSSQQLNLLEDIEKINKLIIECNIACGIESIDLAQKVFSDSIKKKEKRRRRVFAGKRLSDGVHATDKLQNSWHKLSAAVIVRLATSLTQAHSHSGHRTARLPAAQTKHYQGHSDSEEEVEDEDRSFKRRKTSGGKHRKDSQ